MREKEMEFRDMWGAIWEKRSRWDVTGCQTFYVYNPIYGEGVWDYGKGLEPIRKGDNE